MLSLFTLIRLPLFFLLSFIMPHRSLPAQIFHLTVGGIAVLIVNAFYAKFFGNFFTSLLYKGAAFSWTLFFIATIVIIIFSVTVFGISPKKVGKRIGKQIVHMTKKKQSKPKVNHEDMDDLKKAI